MKRIKRWAQSQFGDSSGGGQQYGDAGGWTGEPYRQVQMAQMAATPNDDRFFERVTMYSQIIAKTWPRY